MTRYRHLLSSDPDAEVTYHADVVTDGEIVEYTIVRVGPDGEQVVERGVAPGLVYEVVGWLRRQLTSSVQHGTFRLLP